MTEPASHLRVSASGSAAVDDVRPVEQSGSLRQFVPVPARRTGDRPTESSAGPVIRRLISMDTPPGTSITNSSGEPCVVVGPSTDQSGTYLQIKYPDGSEMLLTDKALSAYALAPMASTVATVLDPTRPDPTGPDPGVPDPPLSVPDPSGGPPTISGGPPVFPGGPARIGGPKGLPKGPAPKQLGPVGTPAQVQAPLGPVPTSGKLDPRHVATLTVDVPDGELDAGSKMLKAMRSARPAKVNDAGQDKLSNCALATVAAILGARSSGMAAKDVRTSLGIPPSTTAPERVGQSEKIWTIALLDAQTLKGGGVVVESSTASTVKSLDPVPLMNSYTIGSAQYHLMIEFLAHASAKEGTDGGLIRSVHRHGLPGGEMYPEATLLGAMNAYPNGTRFAVFVHTPVHQEVSAHWIYAERFNGKVIFQDFQTNTAATKGADAYLEKFPFSPAAKDKGKGFDDGCFIAVAVRPETGPTVAMPDPEIDTAEIAAEIAMARGYATEWSGKLAKPNKQASSWTLPGSTRLTEIPAPTVVKLGYETVASALGVSRVESAYDITKPGTINIVGHPQLKTVGKQTQVDYDNLNATTKIKQPGRDAAVDDTELAPAPVPAKFSQAATDSQYGAFSKSFNVMAQNTDAGIEINAERGGFTDLIHEAAHGYEAGSLPAHIREGCADIFASMVSTKIQQEHKDPAFAYDYNPSYAPYVVKVEQLIGALGLTAVAELYFSATDSKAELTRLVTASGAVDPAGTVDLLLSENFPADFDTGLAALGPTGTVAPTGTSTPTPSEALYGTRKSTFATLMEAKRAGLETKGLPTGASVMQIAQAFDAEYGNDVMESRLRLLYTHLTETEGEPFAETMTLIQGHEAGIGKVTGEDTEAVRKRLTGSVTLKAKA